MLHPEVSRIQYIFWLWYLVVFARNETIIARSTRVSNDTAGEEERKALDDVNKTGWYLRAISTVFSENDAISPGRDIVARG